MDISRRGVLGLLAVLPWAVRLKQAPEAVEAYREPHLSEDELPPIPHGFKGECIALKNGTRKRLLKGDVCQVGPSGEWAHEPGGPDGLCFGVALHEVPKGRVGWFATQGLVEARFAAQVF